jgi:hypothetical protein
MYMQWLGPGKGIMMIIPGLFSSDKLGISEPLLRLDGRQVMDLKMVFKENIRGFGGHLANAVAPSHRLNDGM